MPGFKFIDGVMVKVRDDVPLVTAVPVSTENVPLAVLCTPEDMMETKVKVPESTQRAMMECAEEEYVKRFNTNQPIDESEILNRLSHLFAQYEVPVGLLHKLLLLKEYNIHIILDDSSSMKAPTDLCIDQVGPYLANELRSFPSTTKMTRWHEQEDRLHIMLDFLACIPTGTVLIRFMNRPVVIELKHNDTPQQWAAKAHTLLREACKQPPNGFTPTYEVLKQAFTESRGKTMHYLFTDGVPNDGPEDVARLILERKNPEANPLALISCTDQDEECRWMKEIEEKAPYTSETDDFIAERGEVLHDQGPVFPYTKGLWLMSLLVGAICPHDLDALDDSRPLSRFTMSQILGRELTEQEYRKYWVAHPKQKDYEPKYKELLTVPAHSAQILGSYVPSRLSRFTSKMKSFGFT